MHSCLGYCIAQERAPLAVHFLGSQGTTPFRVFQEACPYLGTGLRDSTLCQGHCHLCDYIFRTFATHRIDALRTLHL